MPSFLYPDVEAAFIGVIGTALTGRPETYAADVMVRNQVPKDAAWPTSKRLVVVRDDGGPTKWWGQGTARIGVRVWAATAAEAFDLANLVVALVDGWRDETVRWSSSTRPYDVTEESRRPAMYFTSELTIRGGKLPAA